MLKTYPLIIHIFKVVDNCGKLKNMPYFLIFYKFLILWRKIFSTIYMWILRLFVLMIFIH